MASSDHGEAAIDPLIGSVVGDRYRISGILGTGGMGTVYRAEHVVIGKAVALKVLRDFGDNSVFVRRFEREASATGRIEHPNCVTASDGGQLDDGRLFLAMELVAGEGLADVLRVERRLPLDRALRICSHVLRGLAFAHEAGVVHRDIKPENIVLVETDGDPDFAKILDFGIAKLLDDAELEVDQHKATQIGTTIGTPTYMCPEQAFGQQVDGRADLYATGVMLFEMVAGRPPYEAESSGTLLSMHVRDPIPRVADVAPEVAVPPAFDALIREALAKERKDRIANAETFLERIDAIAAAPEAALAAAPAAAFEATPTPAPAPAVTPVATAPVRSLSSPVVRPVTLPGAPRRRWTRVRIAAVGGGVLGLLGLIALIGGGGGGAATKAPPGAEGVQAPVSLPAIRAMSPTAVEAREMYRGGHHRAVVEYLEAKRAEIDTDPDALVVLGHAYLKTRRVKEALYTYDAAAELDAGVGGETEVAEACRAGLSSRRGRTRAAARALVEKLVKRPHSTAIRDLLTELAVDERSASTRAWARQLAKGAGIRVDTLASLALDLDQKRSCEDRRAVIAEMVALGDRDAIPILENARKRVRRAGFLRLRRRNTNRCLQDDIDRAILELR